MSRMSIVNRLAVAGVVSALAAISLAACGSGSSPSTAGQRAASTSSTSAAANSSTTSRVRSSTTTRQTSTSSSAPASPARARQGQAEREAVYALVECLRTNGIVMPPPNTSGKGPIYDLHGVNTSSATFKHARTVCVPKAEAAIRAAEHKS